MIMLIITITTDPGEEIHPNGTICYNLWHQISVFRKFSEVIYTQVSRSFLNGDFFKYLNGTLQCSNYNFVITDLTGDKLPK